jgi:hypothetical protein
MTLFLMVVTILLRKECGSYIKASSQALLTPQVWGSVMERLNAGPHFISR